MKYPLKSVVIGLTGLFIGQSGLHAETVAQDIKTVKEAVQQFVYDIADKDTVITSFDRESSILSDAALAEIRTTLAAVMSDGNIKEVLVVGYADKPYPKDSSRNLSQGDLKLAKRRGEVVKDAVAKLGGRNVVVYNMAEKSGWLAKKLVTKDSQVKNEAGKKPKDQTSEDAFYQALGKRLADKGGPGKVVTVVRYENPVSH